MRKTRIFIKLIFLSASCLFSLLFFSPAQAQAVSQAALDPSQIQLNSLTLDQLQQAAQAGDPDAQYALGYMYYYGKNVPQNTQTAMDWIKRAAVQGQTQATKALALLNPSQANVATVATPATPATPPVAVANTATNMTSSSNTVNTNQLSSSQAANVNKNIAAVTVTTAQTTHDNVSSTTQTVTVKTDKKIKTPESVAVVTGSGLTSGAELQKAPSSYYTIQLLASSRENDLQQYTRTHKLQGKATYYHSKTNGKDWYVLVYGLYKSRSEAQSALAKLPENLRAEKPWVKSIASVQKSMKEG